MTSGFGYVIMQKATGEWWGLRVQRSTASEIVEQQAPDSADLAGIWESLRSAEIRELIARENATYSERRETRDMSPTCLEYWEDGHYTPGALLSLSEERPAGKTFRAVLARLRRALNIP